MKDFLNNFLKWSSIWLGIVFVLWISYFALKARQTTNPNIADDGQWLYATAGTTLTAGKWNEIVARNPLKVKIMDGTLGTDSDTIAHWLDWSKITNIFCKCYDTNTSQYLNLTFAYYNTSLYYRTAHWTNTNLIIRHTNICNSQAYSCTIYYLP